MALFDKTATKSGEGKPFIALLDSEGELVAFVQPAGKVDPESLVLALEEKGLNVELREPKPVLTDIKL